MQPDKNRILGEHVDFEDNLVSDYGVVNFSKIKETVYVNPLFPNNFLMNVYNGILRYLSDKVPRDIKYQMITTYQKGIERLHKEYLQDVNTYVKPFPSLILQPNIIKIDERINNVWNTESAMSEVTVRNAYPPYTSIGNMKLWVVPNRFTTTFDVFYIGESYAEILDMQFHMNRLFNTRYRYIEGISESQIMLPDTVITEIEELYQANLFELSDDFTFSFESAYNRTFYTTPWKNNIHIKLVDSSDGSNYFGDTELPTYRINFSFEAFFQLPNHLVLGYENKINSVSIDLGSGHNSTKDSLDINTQDGLKSGEVYIVHIFDDYPENISISLSRSKINPDIFASYFVKLTNVESGIPTIYTQDDTDKFKVTIDDNAVTFNIYDVPDDNIIDIIGTYVNS